MLGIVREFLCDSLVNPDTPMKQILVTSGETKASRYLRLPRNCTAHDSNHSANVFHLSVIADNHLGLTVGQALFQIPYVYY